MNVCVCIPTCLHSHDGGVHTDDSSKGKLVPRSLYMCVVMGAHVGTPAKGREVIDMVLLDQQVPHAVRPLPGPPFQPHSALQPVMRESRMLPSSRTVRGASR